MAGPYSTRRSAVISVRVTPRDRDRIRRAADELDTTMSTFMAEWSSRGARLTLSDGDDPEGDQAHLRAESGT